MARGVSRSEGEPDARIIERILAGEIDLFEEIVRRYQRLVASVAYRLGVRPSDLEDMVSEVFIKAYRNLGRFRPEHAFSTWLYRLATNRVLDELRARRREGRSEEITDALADGGPGTDRGAEDRDRAVAVAAALDQLPEEYRVPLVLLHMEGHKVAEIAVVLGIPEGTVKTRLSRGRERLRQVLVRRFPEYSV